MGILNIPPDKFATHTFRYLSVGHNGEPVGEYFIPVDFISFIKKLIGICEILRTKLTILKPILH